MIFLTINSLGKCLYVFPSNDFGEAILRYEAGQILEPGRKSLKQWRNKFPKDEFGKPIIPVEFNLDFETIELSDQEYKQKEIDFPDCEDTELIFDKQTRIFTSDQAQQLIRFKNELKDQLFNCLSSLEVPFFATVSTSEQAFWYQKGVEYDLWKSGAINSTPLLSEEATNRSLDFESFMTMKVEPKILAFRVHTKALRSTQSQFKISIDALTIDQIDDFRLALNDNIISTYNSKLI